MKEFKGTKGKWLIESSYQYKCISDEKGNLIASMSAKPDYPTIENAKLIAAAPELLEALQHLLNANPNDGRWDYQASCEHARKAISKALD